MLDYAQHHLKKSMSSTFAEREALTLVAFVLQADVSFVLAHGDEETGVMQRWRIKKMIRKRAHGMPLAYLTHSMPFHGHTFYVDERVLIPRPETEELVELIIREYASHRAPRTILDVGTGSGCILISLAVAFPQALLIGIDSEKTALRVARKNAVTHGCDQRTTFLHGDLLPKLEHPADLIVANLPYLRADEMSEPTIAHEPYKALYGGSADGTHTIKKFIVQLPQSLAPKGKVYMEMGIRQAKPLVAFAEQSGFGTKVLRDLAGRNRFLCMEKYPQ